MVIPQVPGQVIKMEALPAAWFFFFFFFCFFHPSAAVLVSASSSVLSFAWLWAVSVSGMRQMASSAICHIKYHQGDPTACNYQVRKLQGQTVWVSFDRVTAHWVLWKRQWINELTQHVFFVNVCVCASPRRPGKRQGDLSSGISLWATFVLRNGFSMHIHYSVHSSHVR